MAPEQAERRLAAIMFTDIVGYTALMARDEEAGLRARERHRQLVRPLVERHHGESIEARGDESLSVFPTALDAVRCALAIQEQVEGDPELRLHVGIHLGDVVVQAGEVSGDGVNIASRLCSLSEGGNVCVSAEVYQAVRNHPDIAAISLGERELKNVGRPVALYAVGRPGSVAASQPAPRGRHRLRRATAALTTLLLVGAALLWISWPAPVGLLLDVYGVSGPPVAPPLPDEPSIVVLPFDNMSGDPEQDYFADGLAEDLTTDLSGIRGLFVIARNSAFHYKGSGVPLDAIGRGLGVRYALEGSVRRGEDRVRITAQLIDTASGFHLWSERYDRKLDDLFSVQSEITERIVGALDIEIRDAEMERVRRKPTSDLTAYDAVVRGIWHVRRMTRADNAEARRLFERAIELDSDYAEARAWLGVTYGHEMGFFWNLDPALVDRSLECGRRALELDPLLPMGHVRIAVDHIARGRPEEAAAAARRAVELAPSFDVPHFVLAMALQRGGRYLAAAQEVRRALRLSLRPPPIFLVALGYVNLRAGRSDEAVRIWEEVRASNPDMIPARIPLAIHYERTGRHAEARALADEILKVNPRISAEIAALQDASGPTSAEAVRLLRSAGLPEAPPAPADFTVPGFGDVPAIAVLPFDNLSGDPDQEYFADGLAEDLITRLSTWGRFPVIARNSSFTYRGEAVDVQQVGHGLGARYVVEGSVRRSADRIRVSAQLIDSTTGHHVWADSYDNELRDLFAVQDEITGSIVATMVPEITRSELRRVAHRPTANLSAYELTMRGWWHFDKGTARDNAKARELFERAVELDPTLAAGWAWLANAHCRDVERQLTDHPAASLSEAARAARECLAQDDAESACYLAVGSVHLLEGDQREMIAAMEQALALAPSDAGAHGALGMSLALAARSAEAIEHLRAAIRLDPKSHGMPLWMNSMAWAHFAAGHYEEALDWSRRVVRIAPDNELGYRGIAASSAHLGRLDEARAAVADELRLQPKLTVAEVRRVNASTDPNFRERWLDGLRKAGLPER